MASRKEPPEPSRETRRPVSKKTIEMEQPLGLLNWNYSGIYRLRGTVKTDRTDARLASGSLAPPQKPEAEPTVFWSKARSAMEPQSPGEHLGIKLHIDIDGLNPLNVVRGKVAELRLYPVIRRPVQFAGQVVMNKINPNGRTLMVERLAFTWPGTREIINRIMIKLTPALPCDSRVAAEVTFITAGCRTRGPFILNRTADESRDEDTISGM